MSDNTKDMVPPPRMDGGVMDSEKGTPSRDALEQAIDNALIKSFNKGGDSMPQQFEKTIRGSILSEARWLTTGDRNTSYGDPIDNLTVTADYMSTYINAQHKTDIELTASDVAMLMVLMKVSRGHNSYKHDNAVDGAAYFAIAGECAELEGE